MALYSVQFYRSDESRTSPYAASPDEDLWEGTSPGFSKEEATMIAKEWAKGNGEFRTCRVVEHDDEGKAIGVVWMSVWEQPAAKDKDTQGVSGIPGESCKIVVWAPREMGPPDHWNWIGAFSKVCDDNNNAWDLDYGRAVSSRGKETQYSLKLDFWLTGKKPPAGWKWDRFFAYLFGVEPEQVDYEFVRSHPIEPREFPAGLDTVDCHNCNKTHLHRTSWRSYDSDGEDLVNYCSCFCIDEIHGEDYWREDPNGEDYEDPGCEAIREGSLQPA